VRHAGNAGDMRAGKCKGASDGLVLDAPQLRMHYPKLILAAIFEVPYVVMLVALGLPVSARPGAGRTHVIYDLSAGACLATAHACALCTSINGVQQPTLMTAERSQTAGPSVRKHWQLVPHSCAMRLCGKRKSRGGRLPGQVRPEACRPRLPPVAVPVLAAGNRGDSHPERVRAAGHLPRALHLLHPQARVALLLGRSLAAAVCQQVTGTVERSLSGGTDILFLDLLIFRNLPESISAAAPSLTRGMTPNLRLDLRTPRRGFKLLKSRSYMHFRVGNILVRLQVQPCSGPCQLAPKQSWAQAVPSRRAPARVRCHVNGCACDGSHHKAPSA